MPLRSLILSFDVMVSLAEDELRIGSGRVSRRDLVRLGRRLRRLNRLYHRLLSRRDEPARPG